MRSPMKSGCTVRLSGVDVAFLFEQGPERVLVFALRCIRSVQACAESGCGKNDAQERRKPISIPSHTVPPTVHLTTPYCLLQTPVELPPYSECSAADWPSAFRRES